MCRCVGYVSADEPLALGFVGDDFHHLQTFLVGQAPELTHPPGAPGAAGTQLLDMADVMAHPGVVKLVVRGEGRDQSRPLAFQGLLGPFLRFLFGIGGHRVTPLVWLAINCFSLRHFMPLSSFSPYGNGRTGQDPARWCEGRKRSAIGKSCQWA